MENIKTTLARTVELLNDPSIDIVGLDNTKETEARISELARLLNTPAVQNAHDWALFKSPPRKVWKLGGNPPKGEARVVLYLMPFGKVSYEIESVRCVARTKFFCRKTRDAWIREDGSELSLYGKKVVAWAHASDVANLHRLAVLP